MCYGHNWESSALMSKARQHFVENASLSFDIRLPIDLYLLHLFSINKYKLQNKLCAYIYLF